MIGVIAGNVGTGKTLSMVRYAFGSDNVLANFSIKGHKGFTRLMKEHIISKISEVPEGCRKPVVEKKVNWAFWNEHRDCDIFLDEAHNIISSRTSMSKQNIIMSEWLSQIRKIWGASGDSNSIRLLSKLPNNVFNIAFPLILKKSRNIWFATQMSRKIDVNVRDMCHFFIMCNKVEVEKDGKKHVVIVNDVWFGNNQYDAIEMQELGVRPKRCIFLANDYFKKYDSYEIIGMEGYL